MVGFAFLSLGLYSHLDSTSPFIEPNNALSTRTGLDFNFD
jgi:hypothetical protein